VLRFEINTTNNTTNVAIGGLLSALCYEEEAVDQKWQGWRRWGRGMFE